MLYRSLIPLFALFNLGVAQYPPKPEEIETISLSYKETHICETTPGVKSYSGYVHLPPSVTGQEYTTNTFFWFFESRKDPENAPLSIYLGGGPGTTSLFGATVENGPCYVNPDGNSTRLNEWSFNNHVNMLYIDQPNFAGYSYDTLVNGTLDHMSNMITPDPDSGETPETNLTTIAGTFASQSMENTANTTTNGAIVLWHFLQNWVTEFPKYKPNNDKISLWGNSYGGFYGETYFSYFQKQNEAITKGEISKNARKLHLDTLGVTNGCLDTLYEAPLYPQMAFNNSYGLATITEELFNDASNNVTKTGGCLDMINQCRTVQEKYDPNRLGINSTVNEVCAGATGFCVQNVQNAYMNTAQRNPFDISHPITERFPPFYTSTFLNKGWVQSELGVPVNHTTSSVAVPQSFFGVTGDPVIGTKKDLEHILDSGIKVALVFGDLDYRCNWLGAQNTSLHVDYEGAEHFQESDYVSIVTNSSYVGGLVRQYGRFSFSRVYQAGHAVSAYQPETVYKIFSRAMFDHDVATGTTPIQDKHGKIYQSQADCDIPKAPGLPENIPPVECSLWSTSMTCTLEQQKALMDGSAVVENDVVISPKGDDGGDIADGRTIPSGAPQLTI